jgi:hypothetical protein
MTIEGNREPDDEDVLEREEDAAAAEAGSIGGRRPDYDVDEAHRALEEAGEGEEEGFEEAERELIEAASHGDNRVDPEDDEFPPEEDALDATPEYGEPDEEEPPDL